MQVVYVNGLEVYRRNMPTGAINSTVFARWPGEWTYQTQLLSGGWLRKGANQLAVELHRSITSTTVFFDLNFSGQREGITCTPAPP